MSYRRIHVIGGANGIGRWFAEKIFVPSDMDVHVYDKDHGALSRLNSKIARIPVPCQTDYAHLGSLIRSGDWVAFAIPVHILPEVAEELCKHLPSGCLLIDFSSVKDGPLKILHRNAPDHATILGIHPLFGPLITSPVGQIVAVTPLTSNCVQSQHFCETLQSAGLLISYVSATQHDEAMAYVQALTHFSYLSFAKTIVLSGQSFSKLSALRTPPFHFLSAFAGRILSGSPSTYANIQRTESAKEVRRLFLTAALELDSSFSSDDLQASIEAFEKIRSPISGSEILACTSISRLATDTLEQLEQRLHELRERKTIFVFRSTENETLRVGRIESVGTDSVVCSEPVKKLKTSSGPRFAIALNEKAVKNYRRKGIEFGIPVKFTLMKRKIVFLSDSEQEQWLKNNMVFLKRSATFTRNGPFEPEVLEHLIPRFVRHVLSIVFLDLYRRRNEPEKITLEVEFDPQVSFDSITDDIQEFITIFRPPQG